MTKQCQEQLYATLPAAVEPLYKSDARIVLFQGDVAQLLDQLPADSVDLVITSPPYNLGKSYENACRLKNIWRTCDHRRDPPRAPRHCQ